MIFNSGATPFLTSYIIIFEHNIQRGKDAHNCLNIWHEKNFSFSNLRRVIDRYTFNFFFSFDCIRIFRHSKNNRALKNCIMQMRFLTLSRHWKIEIKLTEHFFFPMAKGIKVSNTFFFCLAGMWTLPTRQKKERINDPKTQRERVWMTGTNP